jgi:hypothetical protein
MVRQHRVHKVPGFLSSRQNWIPHPLESVVPSLWVQGGRHTHLKGEGVGEPIPTMRQTLCYSRHTLIPLRTTATKRGHLFILVRGQIYLPYDATHSRQKKRAKIFASHVVRPSNTTLVLFILCPPVSLSSFLKA